MSRTVTKNDPNDWARKRKEAMDRAKLKREERKNGIPGGDDDENHTFKPQINKRPQYLKKEDSNQAAAPYRDPNDIFEKPLPGASGKQQFYDQIEQPLATANGNGGYGYGNGIPAVPQPLSSYSKPKPQQNGSHHHDSVTATESRTAEKNYKSKFMQQYDQQQPGPAPSQGNSQGYSQSQARGYDEEDEEPPYLPTQRSKADAEAEETFMGSLRGSAKNSAGSGWNDDTSNVSIPALPKKVSYRRRKSTDQNQPPNPTISSRPSPRQPAPPQEWNQDFGSGIPSLPTNQQYLRRDNIQSSPSNINRGIDSAGNGGVSDVSQVRSRLSLLKSKMRKTESGSDLRSLSASEKERERQRPLQRERGDEWDDPPVDSYATQQQPKRGGRRQQQQQPLVNPPWAAEDSNGNSNEYERHPPPQQGHGQGNRRVGEARQQMQAQQRDYRDEPVQVSTRSHQQAPAGRGAQRNNYPPPSQSYEYDQPPSHPQHSHDPYASQDPFGAGAGDEDGGGMLMGEQLECPDCGRKFNRIPYEKHVKVCAKIFIQKRKVFDSKQKRIPEELVQLQKETQGLGRGKKKGGKGGAAAGAAGGGAGSAADRAIQVEKKAKWKEQSNAFREAMRMARMAKQAEETGGPMPQFTPSAPDPSFIRCENCGRSFNERAAERHIPLCSNIRAKPSSLKRGSGGAGGKTGTVPGSVALGPTGGVGGTTGAPKPLPARSKPKPSAAAPAPVPRRR